MGSCFSRCCASKTSEAEINYPNLSDSSSVSDIEKLPDSREAETISESSIDYDLII